MSEEMQKFDADWCSFNPHLAAKEIERLTEELAVFMQSYSEISMIVGRQGTEEHSLADDVRAAVANQQSENK